MLKNIKAAIFDLDGTLVDSMWVWEKIDIDYLSKKNIDMPKDLRNEIEHLSFDQTAAYFKKRFNLKDSIEDIKKEWSLMAYEEYRKNIFLKAGVKEFLDFLKKNKIKIALATSNSQTLLELVLKNNGIYEYFDVITTTNEVSRGKNFPDVYLLTAERLNVAPQDCIVFEDILPAILAAKSVGMKVAAVYDLFSQAQKDSIIKFSDIFIEDFSDFPQVI